MKGGAGALMGTHGGGEGPAKAGEGAVVNIFSLFLPASSKSSHGQPRSRLTVWPNEFRLGPEPKREACGCIMLLREHRLGLSVFRDPVGSSDVGHQVARKS